MIIHRAALISAFVLTFASLTVAQTSAPAVSMARPAADDGLAPKFESPAGGVSLRPPAGMKIIRGGIGGTEVVRFTNDEKRWLVILSQIQLDQDKPLPLTTWRDPKGQMQPGMLEVTVEQFKTLTPGATILRNFADDADAKQIGFMAAKYNLGLESTLTQQAIIRASNLRYYILAFNSPAPRDKELEADPAVQHVVELFGKMVNSVELFDQTDIRHDQDERLFRTRSLYLNFTEQKLRNSLVREQWFRFIKDGKDVGYSYVVQEIARDIPRKGMTDTSTGPEGVLVGVRSRLMPEPGTQTDAESWFFMTFNRKTESFSTVVYTTSPKSTPVTSGEVGITRFRQKPVPTKQIPIGTTTAPSDMILSDEYRIEVTRIAPNVASEPVARDLPPYYMPQALYQILPNVLPRNEQKTYLFASWITEVGQLMYRYLDVGGEQEINFAGKRVRAIPIKDKIGLEGTTTTHYVTSDGKYLGSANPDAHMTVLASDPVSIETLWKNANLTKPGAVEPGK